MTVRRPAATPVPLPEIHLTDEQRRMAAALLRPHLKAMAAASAAAREAAAAKPKSRTA